MKRLMWCGLASQAGRTGELKEILLQEDWVLVTRNCKDFRGPKGAPGSKGVLADVPIHAGLICIDGPVGMDLELQRRLFGVVLEDLDEEPDLTNQVLEITIDASGQSVDILRYELPAES
jgi:hypothetical protein